MSKVKIQKGAYLGEGDDAPYEEDADSPAGSGGQFIVGCPFVGVSSEDKEESQGK